MADTDVRIRLSVPAVNLSGLDDATRKADAMRDALLAAERQTRATFQTLQDLAAKERQQGFLSPKDQQLRQQAQQRWLAQGGPSQAVGGQAVPPVGGGATVTPPERQPVTPPIRPPAQPPLHELEREYHATGREMVSLYDQQKRGALSSVDAARLREVETRYQAQRKAVEERRAEEDEAREEEHRRTQRRARDQETRPPARPPEERPPERLPQERPPEVTPPDRPALRDLEAEYHATGAEMVGLYDQQKRGGLSPADTARLQQVELRYQAQRKVVEERRADEDEAFEQEARRAQRDTRDRERQARPPVRPPDAERRPDEPPPLTPPQRDGERQPPGTPRQRDTRPRPQDTTPGRPAEVETQNARSWFARLLPAWMRTGRPPGAPPRPPGVGADPPPDQPPGGPPGGQGTPPTRTPVSRAQWVGTTMRLQGQQALLAQLQQQAADPKIQHDQLRQYQLGQEQAATQRRITQLQEQVGQMQPPPPTPPDDDEDEGQPRRRPRRPPRRPRLPVDDERGPGVGGMVQRGAGVAASAFLGGGLGAIAGSVLGMVVSPITDRATQAMQRYEQRIRGVAQAGQFLSVAYGDVNTTLDTMRDKYQFLATESLEAMQAMGMHVRTLTGTEPALRFARAYGVAPGVAGGMQGRLERLVAPGAGLADIASAQQERTGIPGIARPLFVEQALGIAAAGGTDVPTPSGAFAARMADMLGGLGQRFPGEQAQMFQQLGQGLNTPGDEVTQMLRRRAIGRLAARTPGGILTIGKGPDAERVDLNTYRGRMQAMELASQSGEIMEEYARVGEEEGAGIPELREDIMHKMLAPGMSITKMNRLLRRGRAGLGPGGFRALDEDLPEGRGTAEEEQRLRTQYAPAQQLQEAAANMEKALEPIAAGLIATRTSIEASTAKLIAFLTEENRTLVGTVKEAFATGDQTIKEMDKGVKEGTVTLKDIFLWLMRAMPSVSSGEPWTGPYDPTTMRRNVTPQKSLP